MIRYKGVKTLEVLEGADNYNRWIADKLRPHLISPVLEIGAGIGNISTYFLKNKKLVLTDSDRALVSLLKKRFINHKNVSVETLNISKDLKKHVGYFKSIYLVNVLEHIKDDKKALRNINTLLSKKGMIIVLVPAKKRVYGKLDKELGHFRRYEKDELINKLQISGFKIVDIQFFNIVGLLSWIIRDKVNIQSKHELKPYQVKIFDAIVPILKIIEPSKGLPLGISLIVIAQKK